GLRGGGTRVIADVGRLGCRRRADRPAVDPGAADRGEEQPVETRVAADPGPFANRARGEGGSVLHARRLAPPAGPDWPFSDMDASRRDAGKPPTERWADSAPATGFRGCHRGRPARCQAGAPAAD